MKSFIGCSLACIPQKWIPVLRSEYASYKRGYIGVDQTRGGGASPRNTDVLRLANSSNEVGGRPSNAPASGHTFASLPLRRSANNSNKASARCGGTPAASLACRASSGGTLT